MYLPGVVKVTFVVRPNGVSRELSMPGNDANPLPCTVGA